MIRMPTVCRNTLLLGIVCLASVGCQGFNLFGPFQNRPVDGAVTKDDKANTTQGKPGKYNLRIAPYVFLSDYELNKDQALFKELAGLRDQVCKELNLSPSERPVLVHLFEDKERYESFMQMRYPELPKRRAFFIAQPRPMGGEDLLVFTYRSDRIQQDLRHELTHALLHSVLTSVPLWLDEGLAEYFELPQRNVGVNDSHLTHIRRSTTEAFRPDLARLESLKKVTDMSPAEYRESWAWAHYFLRGNKQAKGVLLAYLQQLKTNPQPGLLRQKLTQVVAAPEDALRGHLTTVEYARR